MPGGIYLISYELRWSAILLAMSLMVIPMHAQEIRGAVATDTQTWTADDFAGFYYDIDDNIKTEVLTATVSEGKRLLEPDGVTYNTETMADDFEFEDWGAYNVIGFMGEKYFAGYLDNAFTTDDILFEESDDENVLYEGQLMTILLDSDKEMILVPGVPLELAEGYRLNIKNIDDNGMLLELTKNGQVIDSKILLPSTSFAGMDDKTYYFKKDIGDAKGIVTIAVHFKNAITIGNQTMATVDGLWQLSDEARDVSEDTEYGRMTIQMVTANAILMNNEDNDITLSRNQEILLMPGISIRTANSYDDALRYYIFSEVKCDCE